LQGKIGSNITSEIGSMKVTEQIDSLEIMGVNSGRLSDSSENYRSGYHYALSGCILCIFFGLIGGLIVGPIVGVVTVPEYIDGIRYLFRSLLCHLFVD
jgi:phospholipid/cholesterol/gamma-HCH transport system permease protein